MSERSDRIKAKFKDYGSKAGSKIKSKSYEMGYRAGGRIKGYSKMGLHRAKSGVRSGMSKGYVGAKGRIKKYSAKRLRPVKKSKLKKTMIILAILMVGTLVLACLTPFIANTVNDWKYAGDYSQYPIGHYEAVNLTDNVSNNITQGNPNYSINQSYNQQFEISDVSRVVKYNEHEYNWQYGDIFMNVTDLNLTPIIDIPVIINAYAVDVSPWYINWAYADKITIIDNQEIIFNGGDDSNGYVLKGGWGGFGEGMYVYNIHVSFTLPESVINAYSDFAVSQDFVINYDKRCNFNVQLERNGNTQLFKIKDSCLNNTDMQGVENKDRDLSSYTSLGNWDTDYSEITSDIFYANDTTNSTNDFYRPMISVNPNNVFKITEKRVVGTRDFTGKTNSGTISLWYEVFDKDGKIISPETYLIFGIFSKLDGTNITSNQVVGNSTYILTYSLIFNGGTDCIYELMPMVRYNDLVIHDFVYENLGKTKFNFVDCWTQYITSFKYKFNNYFGSNQIVHRIIYDYNDKLPLICDCVTPLYLNNTFASFKFRYFMDIGDDTGLNLNSPSDTDNTFKFVLRVIIKDDDGVYMNKTVNCKIGFYNIGFCNFVYDLGDTGLKDLTSYSLSVYIYSDEEVIPQYQVGRNTALYTESLYYIFRNFMDFRKDVKDMEDLIASLKVKEDIGGNTYGEIKDIVGVMKAKMDYLETDANKLRAEYPNQINDIWVLLGDSNTGSIKMFKDYVVLINAFCNVNTADKVRNDNGLFNDLKHYLSCINLQYSDSFSLYNAYVCGLNGETQITQDFIWISDGYRTIYRNKWIQDKGSDLFNTIPMIVTIIALIVSLIMTLLFYYVTRNRFKKKWTLYLGCILIFIIAFILTYWIMTIFSTSILYWWYGVGQIKNKGGAVNG